MSSATFEHVAIGQVQAYWDRRPCNIRHSTAPTGTREYFEQVRERKYRVEPHIPRFAEFPRWAGKRVLEIGCGIGTDTMSFLGAGASVTAVDLSTQSLALAKQRAEVYGVADRVTFYNANAEELDRDVPVESYDLIYSFGVLHHTPRPDRAFAQLRRYLKPGGVLKVMVYHRVSWKVLHLMLTESRGRFWRIDEAVARQSEAQTGCPVTYTYSRSTGRRLLERHGFRVTEAWVDHIFPWRIRDYVEYRYVKAMPWRLMPGPMFRALERRLGWHLCLTATG